MLLKSCRLGCHTFSSLFPCVNTGIVSMPAKVRRLYDIANILSSLKLIEKVGAQPSARVICNNFIWGLVHRLPTTLAHFVGIEDSLFIFPENCARCVGLYIVSCCRIVTTCFPSPRASLDCLTEHVYFNDADTHCGEPQTCVQMARHEG